MSTYNIINIKTMFHNVRKVRSRYNDRHIFYNNTF